MSQSSSQDNKTKGYQKLSLAREYTIHLSFKSAVKGACLCALVID